MRMRLVGVGKFICLNEKFLYERKFLKFAAGLIRENKFPLITGKKLLLGVEKFYAVNRAVRAEINIEILPNPNGLNLS